MAIKRVFVKPEILKRKNNSTILTKLKEKFIIILNNDQDGIWPPPTENFPALWPQDTCCGGLYKDKTYSFPWSVGLRTTTPSIQGSYLFPEQVRFTG